MFREELAKTHPVLGLDPSRVTVVADLHIGGGIDLTNTDAAKRARFEHRGLERQLRRKAYMHLLVARRGGGLVIEKKGHAFGVDFDAVGDGGKTEGRAVKERKAPFALLFDVDFLCDRAAAPLEAQHLPQTVDEARPAEREEIGIVKERSELVPSPRQETLLRAVEQKATRLGLNKFGERFMHGGADLARASFAAEGLQRRKLQDALRINRIRVAPQLLDTRHAELRRAQRQGRLRLGPFARRDRLGHVERRGDREHLLAALSAGRKAVAGERLKSREKARGDRR